MEWYNDAVLKQLRVIYESAGEATSPEEAADFIMDLVRDADERVSSRYLSHVVYSALEGGASAIYQSLLEVLPLLNRQAELDNNPQLTDNELKMAAEHIAQFPEQYFGE